MLQVNRPCGPVLWDSSCEVLVHWLWLAFFGVVAVLLLLQRKTFRSTSRTAVYWTGAWFAIGLAFAVVVYPVYEHAWLGATLDEATDRPGADASMKFLAAYLLEYALAFDNLIVISLLFRQYRVPRAHQPRVLFWGLVLATGVRFVVLLGATSLARGFEWVFCVFGAVILYSGVVTAWAPNDGSRATRDNWLVRFLWANGRLVRGEFGGRFIVVHDGRRALTAVSMCLVSAALVELVFALDSVAVLSVSTTTFVLVTSNVLASMALRGWFPLLDTIQAWRSPTKTMAALLVLVGLKLLSHAHVYLPPAIVLVAIVALVAAAVVESWTAT